MTDYAKKNQWGQPLIPDPTTGEEKAWVRVTTVAGTMDDKNGLLNWTGVMVAGGGILRPDIAGKIAARWPLTDDNKAEMYALAEELKEAGGASVGRNLGDTLHEMVRRRNQGETFKPMPPWDADLRAFEGLLETAGLTVHPALVERTVVLPELGVAGSFDLLTGVVKAGGELCVADLKGLAIDTPVPTPTGWSTMAALAVGDEVFDSHGHRCRVTAKSGTQWKDCYRITFDDGSTLIADADHRWPVSHGHAQRQAPAVFTTTQVRAQLHHYVRIATCGPLDLPEVELPIDPYLFGAWLGDGNRGRGVITKPADHPLWAAIEATGARLGVLQIDKRTGCATRTVLGLQSKLKQAGFLGHKRIPDVYLRASAAQRLALLQGLMDTDGTWNKGRGQAVFSSIDKALAHQARELMLSLGFRPYLATVDSFGFGKAVTSYPVAITPTVANPFRARAGVCAADVGGRPYGKSARRVVRSVDRCPTVATQCITVDSPDQTYLCGEEMIPTHNTGKLGSYSWGSIAVQLALYSRAEHIYDWDTGKFTPMPPVNQRRGLIIHLPAGTATATLHVVDLVAGWEAAQLAMAVRQWRARRDLARPARI